MRLMWRRQPSGKDMHGDGEWLKVMSVPLFGSASVASKGTWQTSVKEDIRQIQGWETRPRIKGKDTKITQEKDWVATGMRSPLFPRFEAKGKVITWRTFSTQRRFLGIWGPFLLSTSHLLFLHSQYRGSQFLPNTIPFLSRSCVFRASSRTVVLKLFSSHISHNDMKN